MKKYDLEKIRNVALIGPGSSGKTTLGEGMMFLSGVTTRLGSVDDGTSVLDFEPEEKERQYTISSAFAFVEHKKHRVSIVDTPGYDQFLYDAQACLGAVDAALMVVAGEREVKFEAEKLWQYCEDYGLPRAILVNRLDKERTDFAATLDALRAAFDIPLVAIHLPIGAETQFQGYVDLLRMVACTATDASGKLDEGPIPDALADAAQAARDAMVECLVETDDALMEQYFEGESIGDEELRAALRKGTLSGQFVPVVLGAASKNIGTTAVLDLFVEVFPSPLERGDITGRTPKGEDAARSPAADAPFSALVFKTISDPFTGRLNIFRVFSGTLTSDSSVWNATRQTEERVGQILMLVGKETKPAPQAGPGDIVAVAKLKETMTGDTFCTKAQQILLPSAPPPAALISFAAYPKAKGDEEKMGQGLRRMQDEDPTLRIGREDQTHELLVSGMGKLHLDVVCERMKRKYGAEVDLRKPRVPYRETLKGSTKAQGRHKKQTGGRGQFADTWIEIRPLARGGGFEFVDKIVGGAIPRQYIPAVEQGIRERMAKGILAGYPVVDVQVTLYDGKYHDVDSSEMAFKIAGSLGFKKGAAECKPVLLEPIMETTIRVPDDYMGDVIGDLNSRRGRVLGMDPQSGEQIIRANVPLAEMLEYAPDLRSMTAGRGTFQMKFDHYDEVPSQLADKIVAEAKFEGEEE